MFRTRPSLLVLTVLGAVLLSACSKDPEPEKPVMVQGHVYSSSGAPIAGARVTALDVNDAPVSSTVITDSDGAYELNASSARNESIKLRASASGFTPFPSGIRRSLPVNISGAVESKTAFVFSSPATDIVLEPLENPGGRGSLSGSVGLGGVLVVAEGPGVGTAISDIKGNYVVFNLLAGTYTVRAYVAGSQFPSVDADVVTGQETKDVNLARSGDASGSVSGSVNIVNAPGGSATSVVLVVASTFNDVTLRGEVPRGLRTPQTGPPDVNGPFTISGVPDGTYKVLAAFENDGLVRDPDANIAGTQIVEVTVNGGATTLPTSFKITGALDVVSPGDGDVPTEITGTPTLVWADDSSEDYYTVEVFDAFGNIVWSDPSVPGVSGSPTVSVACDGFVPESGRTYQFRAMSWRNTNGGPTPISSTEDLRGVMVAM